MCIKIGEDWLWDKERPNICINFPKYDVDLKKIIGSYIRFMKNVHQLKLKLIIYNIF